MRLSGWIFDVYPEADGMALWLVDGEGRCHKLTVPFAPAFYLDLDAAPDSLLRFLGRLRVPGELKETTKKDLYADEEIPVVEVKVQNPLAYAGVVAALQRRFPERAFFTCDIDAEALFFYQTGLFPLARVEVETDVHGRLVAWTLDDDPWATHYPLPPLTILELGLEGGFTHPKQSESPGGLSVRVEGREYVLEPGFEARGLTDLIRRHDPHLILTDWGDDYLLAALSKLPGFVRVPFHREEDRLRRRGRPRSYFTYGKVVYSAPSYFFRGRWHVDRQNSFVLHESGLEGLIELARLSKTPPQRTARLSTGSIISAMQLEVAIRESYLVPWRKGTVEAPKTAEALLTIDKGGLTYQPRPGLFENVAEIDFASMYPTLMERFNLSPETVNCTCCAPTSDVPEAGYHTCRRRRGLVPKTIGPLLEKRATYKRLMREESDPLLQEVWKRRQTAIKWLLVTCFGYLGYKNARFGQIEAHEATTALGREKLIQAKEAAEARGFEMLHALTDSIWVRKPGATETDYARLAGEVTVATGIPAALEGVYRWLVFVPSRENPRAGVPNRFFGLFADGETKIRGIELRRSDTPPFIRRAQEKMLEALFRAKDAKAYLALVPKLLEMVEGDLTALREGRVDVRTLAVTRRLSLAPSEYKKANVTAIAAGELLAHGVQLHAGEKVKLILTEAKAPFPGDRAKALALWDGSRGYDAAWYAEELLKAAASVLFPAGWDREALRERFSPEGAPARGRRGRAARGGMRPEGGPSDP